MDDYLETRSLAIDLEKASALQELRPHLVQAQGFLWWIFRWRDRHAVHNAVCDYLARIAHAHIQLLVATPFLSQDVDIEAFADRALEDAKAAASNELVTAIAGVAREAIADRCRVWYLQELQRRANEYRLCPIHSVAEDPREQEEIRAEWAAIREEREARETAELAQERDLNQSVTPPVKLQAKDIQIYFTSEHRVQIIVNGQKQTMNYGDMGFEDRRNGKPKRAWTVLRALASSDGTLPAIRGTIDRPRIEKRIQEIRRLLQSHFGIADDPLPFDDETSGWVARFTIGLRPSSDT